MSEALQKLEGWPDSPDREAADKLRIEIQQLLLASVASVQQRGGEPPMRCPKCHYLSFDPEPRCKNCGYDLEVADAELAFKAAEDYAIRPRSGAASHRTD